MNIFIMIIVYIAFIFIARYLERLCNKLICDIVGYTVWGWLIPGINILLSITFSVMILVELLYRTQNKLFVKKFKNNKIVKWFTYSDYR